MALPLAFWNDNRGTTATSNLVCEGEGIYPVTPNRGTLGNVGNVLLSFAFVPTSTWRL